MRTSISLSALLLLPTLALGGCASADVLTEDESAASEDDLSAASNFGYFVFTQQDMRRCASPFCGGFFVKRVNQARTRCADGTYQAECYVEKLDFGTLPLADATKEAFDAKFQEGHGIVRAFMSSTTVAGRKVGKLRVREAWNAAGEVPVTSTFYRIGDNGIRCVTAPCPTTSAFTLNSNDSMNIVKASFTGVGSSAERTQAGQAVMTEQGVLAAGSIATPRCAANARNCGPWFTAEEFYLPVADAPAARACGGLLGFACGANEFCSFKPEDICGAADAVGTCARRPEACIQVVMPVCGCDGRTYSNACMAANQGVSVGHDGACR